VIPSADFRRRRGAYYRAQILMRERQFKEARALLEDLAHDGGYEHHNPGTVEMQLELRFRLVFARALIATGEGDQGREIIVGLDDELRADAGSPLVTGTFRRRFVLDLGGRLSEIGEHERAVDISLEAIDTAANERRRADALAQLAIRRIAWGFERECAARIVPHLTEQEGPLGIARSLYRSAAKNGDDAIAIRSQLTAADSSYGPQLLHIRAQRTDALFRDTCVGLIRGEAGMEAQLRNLEVMAWEDARDSREHDGVLENERVWRFGRVGSCRAALARLLWETDPEQARQLAHRAQDLLLISYKTRTSDGTFASPETSLDFGELLVLTGQTEEARQVFLDTAENLRKRYGPRHGCTRLFLKLAGECGEENRPSR
jgi:tetratricopeptide (TPR) repeat protein